MAMKNEEFEPKVRYDLPLEPVRLPLKFVDVEPHRKLFALPQPGSLALTYRWEYPLKVQSRFDRRAGLVPDLSLSDYICRAEVDFIAIGFRVDGHLGRARLSEKLRAIIGCRVSVERAEVEADQRWNHTARIQQPTLQIAKTLVRSLNDEPGIECAGDVAQIEFSVDWYAAGKTDAERWLLAELLWRHLLPDQKYWRFEGGYPRCSWGTGKDTRHLLKLPYRSAVGSRPVREQNV